MKKNSYSELVKIRRARGWPAFSEQGLSTKFIPYYENQKRIKVRTVFGDRFGRVGVTTGWVPVFLLMERSNMHGSSITLSDRDEILAVQNTTTKKYAPVNGIQ